MQNFQIYDDEHPAPAVEQPHFQYEEGNWLYRSSGNIRVFAFEDEGEPVHVWVAEKRRVATIDTVADDVPFTLTQGAVA